MLIKGLSLRGLEVFEALARYGSVAQAAAVTGLSQPAVSQQLRNLETALGTPLVDHGRRPMHLTPAGETFLRRARAALSELRIGASELSTVDLAHITDLSLGIIDDFDDDLTPRLALILAESLSQSRFRLITAASTELIRDTLAGQLHMAISASDGSVPTQLRSYPLARDPFIIVAPETCPDDAAALLAGGTDLPFLRYGQDQMIAGQIEALLDQKGIVLPTRFEIGSHLALMAMVARGVGWTITTPLGFMRAARFHAALNPLEVPDSKAARQISLLAGSDWIGDVPLTIAETMRALMGEHTINPAIARMPWLDGHLTLIDA